MLLALLLTSACLASSTPDTPDWFSENWTLQNVLDEAPQNSSIYLDGAFENSSTYVDIMTKASSSNVNILTRIHIGTGLNFTILMPSSQGFCYISEVRAIHRENEDCRIILNNRNWVLDTRSLQPQFQCRATCISGIEFSVTGLFNRNNAGPTASTIDLGPQSRRVCYLTGLRRMASDTQECSVQLGNGRWTMRGRSNHGDFRCEARCVDFAARPRFSSEIGFAVSGSGTRQLGDRDTTFCYISNVRNLNREREHCWLLGTGGAPWTLEYRSAQSTMRCRAVCISVPNFYSAIALRWSPHNVGNRQISMTLAQGSTRSNGRSVTDSWGSSFTLQVASPGFSSLGGVQVSSTISTSTANSISSTVTRSRTLSLSASCPEERGMFVGLFQYHVDGMLFDGRRDTVDTLMTRCHYSTSASVPAPQCPFQACGTLRANPLCQRSLCTAWRR